MIIAIDGRGPEQVPFRFITFFILIGNMMLLYTLVTYDIFWLWQLKLKFFRHPKISSDIVAEAGYQVCIGGKNIGNVKVIIALKWYTIRLTY